MYFRNKTRNGLGRVRYDTPPPSLVTISFHNRVFPILGCATGAGTDTNQKKPNSPTFWQFLIRRVSPKNIKIQEEIDHEVSSNCFEQHEKHFSQNAQFEITRNRIHVDDDNISIRQNDDDQSIYGSITPLRTSEKIKIKTPIKKTSERSSSAQNSIYSQKSTRSAVPAEISSRHVTARATLDPSPTQSSVEILRASDDFGSAISDTKYPLFHIKDPVLTKQDCAEIKKSWKLIVDEDLHYFQQIKEQNSLPQSKTAVAWFYDMFYEGVYTYDANHKSNMIDIFKHNLKIQAHALIVIINNCLSIADKYSRGQKFEFKMMHKAHDILGVKYRHYVIICEILLSTFDRCLREQWTREMEIAWCKLISLLLKSVLPHYRFQHMCSTINHAIGGGST